MFCELVFMVSSHIADIRRPSFGGSINLNDHTYWNGLDGF